MRTEEPKTIHLKDYRPPSHLIDRVHLEVALHPERARVKARLEVRANPAAGAPGGDLVLDGDELNLISVALDGKPLSAADYEASANRLCVKRPPTRFTLETEVEIAPGKNTKLSGLYLADGLYCTQCEPEGFRRITYFIDRPDVLSIYSVRLIAEMSVPVLLANGNETARGEMPGGKHFVDWHDPFPKPAYLFAMAGGTLGVLEDRFRTKSGRDVRLRIFVDPGNEPRVGFAMEALKASMKWDEETFGLEYDLDEFMIVAVRSFNMGAMENKGLNIFNSSLLVASPDTATDGDYQRIEGVIAHEYFHNWTGNRVTCRDWFQLCLKEGLTVFRDQLFSADMRDAAVKRIEDVRGLRARQFQEDDGPLVHPPRPSSFIEIDNFYTATVYEKGAEICRMLQTLLGREGFRRGMDRYIEKNDGTAARVEDFLSSMAEASGRDLSQFALWYSQAGRPIVAAETHYDENTRAFEVTLRQETKATPGEPAKEPSHIPIAFGLLDEAGHDIVLAREGKHAATHVLELLENEQTFRFADCPKPEARSFLRGFSAPVTLKLATTPEEDLFLLAHDSDAFNRWEAGQRSATRLILAGAAAWRTKRALTWDPAFIAALGRTLAAQDLEPAFQAHALTLPSVTELGQAADAPIDFEALHQAREALKAAIGSTLADPLMRAYDALMRKAGAETNAAAAGRRALAGTALSLLSAASNDPTRATAHYAGARTMTDRMIALSILSDMEGDARETALADFYKRFEEDPIVIDKWFRVQAASSRTDTLAAVKRLIRHPAYDEKNPNRVRALVGTYAFANPYRFNTDGEKAFAFLQEEVLKTDKLNPNLAARLLSALENWRRLSPPLQAAAQAVLKAVKSETGLSRNSFEIASKCLGED
ncbi:MAG: aminopeptidase N [Alphaproteobacteria bacterium]